ncbi:MAG: heavy metal translocating P-type ATPase [Chloroflexi bacterium]|nr:heavy metal translocating P-type ATPase [Chloroflexota bacterium]
MPEITFILAGLDCVDCANQIEAVVKKLPGVEKVSVSLASGQMAVQSPAELHEQFNVERLMREVRNLGYSIRPLEAGKRITVFVEGLDCSDEVESIDKKLHGLRGILEHKANLVQQAVEIVYEPGAVEPQDIVRAIAETGLKASMERPKQKLGAWWKERKNVLLLVCGILILAGFVFSWAGAAEVLSIGSFVAAVLVGGYYPARMGLAGVRTLRVNIYTLNMVAVVGAMVIRLWEEAAVLIFVYSLGSVLESYAVGRVRGSLQGLMGMAPQGATVKRHGGEEIYLPVSEIKIGDVAIVKPGEKVPIDGVVVAGFSTVDQSPVTGESIPVPRGQGDDVFAGTINQKGYLEVRVNKLHTDTTLAKIITYVEKAELKKSSYQRFADRFGQIYTPSAFGLAVLTATIAPLFFGQPFAPWFYRALVVLAVSCSCGLALSVPVATVSAVSNAARKGILVKGGASLEAASRARAVVFDKTGTLTIGKPAVTDVVPLKMEEERLLATAAAIETRSEHVLGEAITRKTREEGIQIPHIQEFESMPGVGVRARVNGQLCWVSSGRALSETMVLGERGKLEMARLEREGKTIVIIGCDNEVLGLVGIADRVRPESASTVKALKALGIRKTVMLTGDDFGIARAIAAEVGVDDYRARLLPDDKVTEVKKLRDELGSVVMVGDGVNDAPALAEADVGIAMGAAGTDVAIETADLALMSDNLARIPEILSLSRRTVANIKQNVLASLLINEGSMLIVIANGLRLLK